MYLVCLISTYFQARCRLVFKSTAHYSLWYSSFPLSREWDEQIMWKAGERWDMHTIFGCKTWREGTIWETVKQMGVQYEGNSTSKLQIMIEKNQMEIMTYKQHLFFKIISIQIKTLVPPFHKSLETCGEKFFWLLSEPARCSSSILVRPSENFCTQLWTAWRDRQCSPYMGSISLGISFASIFFSHKKRTTPRCSILVHVLRGAAIL